MSQVASGSDTGGPFERDAQATFITSKDNAFLKALRKLSQESTHYRQTQTFWIEGEHLCQAALDKGLVIKRAVFSETIWPQIDPAFKGVAAQNFIMADALFESISALGSSAHFGFECAMPIAQAVDPHGMTLILDRLQDAGNVGAILRTAAAMGCTQILAIKGSAALWSAKVLRAGMGAHFSLQLHESLSELDLEQLQIPLLATSSHEGSYLHELLEQGRLPHPCAWMMGHEGQGLSAHLMQKAHQHIRILQTHGQESLNVAVAASICVYSSAVMNQMRSKLAP
jgi:TrmH family RNA methyltransferase